MADRSHRSETLIAKLPPQNIEMEQAVLGALLIDKDSLIKIVDQVGPIDFYRPEHQEIYRACMKLFEKRQPIDLLTLSDQLEKDGKLTHVGGVAYLTELTNVVPSAAHIGSHAEVVKANSTLRQLVSAGSKIIELGYQVEGDPDELLTEAEQSLFAISQDYAKQIFTPIKDILTSTFERIDELHKHKGKLRGVSSGFKTLDNLLAGLQPSDLVILAARPSLGKSSLALNIVAHAAIKEKLPVGIFSLEMSRDQLVDRLLISEAGIDSWKLRTGNLTDDDFPRIGYAMGLLSEAPIYIDDSPILNSMELRARARRLQVEHGLGLLVVDYLQLMEGRKRSGDLNRVQEISEISRSLKAVARELNVPVLALSQLSRAVEQRSPKIPQLSDLRESGCLTGDTKILRSDNAQEISIKSLVGQKISLPIFAIDNAATITNYVMVKAFYSGRKQVFLLKTASGKSIKASANHPFYTLGGWKSLEHLAMGERVAVISRYYIGAVPTKMITWDPIIKKQPLGLEDVYDATVNGVHNFVANDFVVHNSIEQDADVVMFIYREDYYEPKTERKNIADILIKKHRHGPIGQVELFFRQEQMRFENLEKKVGIEPAPEA